MSLGETSDPFNSHDTQCEALYVTDFIALLITISVIGDRGEKPAVARAVAAKRRTKRRSRETNSKAYY